MSLLDPPPVGQSHTRETILSSGEQFSYLYDVPDSVQMPDEAYRFNP